MAGMLETAEIQEDPFSQSTVQYIDVLASEFLGNALILFYET